MATLTPVGYNTGSTISGTEQIGDLAIGTSDQDYGAQPGGVTFWMTPDQDLGYVIAKPVPSGNQPNQLSVPAYVGFNRSDALTDNSFVSLSQIIAGQTFASASAAKIWLNSNGYWTSWVSSGPTLLADLDAANSSSYPGTGTDWFDLVGSNDGVLNAGSGTITYGTTNGGEFTLNGGTNTRIEFADNADISLSTTTTKTYSIWINASRVGFVSFSDTIMSKQSGNPAGDGFWVGINSSNQLYGRVTSDGGSTNKFISGVGETISTGTWYMITLIVKVSPDPDTFKLFINTTEVGSTSGGGSSVNDANDLYLGNYQTGLQNVRSFQGKIGELYVYEGDFTSSDVTTLFNNTKTRFGY